MSKTVTNADIYFAKFLAEQNSKEVLEIAVEFAKQKKKERQKK
jgi:hypothetical protein